MTRTESILQSVQEAIKGKREFIDTTDGLRQIQIIIRLPKDGGEPLAPVFRMESE